MFRICSSLLEFFYLYLFKTLFDGQIRMLMCQYVFQNILQRQMSEFKKAATETHVLRVVVKIQKVKLAVRFPCSLSFELKSDDKHISGRGSYQLQKGECSPDETLRIDIQAQKIDEAYKDKYINVVVFMTSTGGKIPAGSASILFTKQDFGETVSQSKKIQKCPDKNAEILYKITTEFQRIVFSSQGMHPVRLQESRISKRKITSHSKVSEHRPKRMMFESSLGKRSSNSRNQVHTPRNERQYETWKSINRIDSNEDFPTNERILELEHQKTELIQQISRLKNQLYANNDLYNIDEHLLKYKDEIDQLSLQLEVAKDKNRTLERREKELATENRELKDELSRKQERNNMNQFEKMENQTIIDERDKVIRQLQAEKKALEEECSDTKISLNTQQKRITFKENSFKEQLNKLNQKYQQSDKERQNAVLQLNKMLQELQKGEKKNQLLIKEKQKSFFEDKNKLNKKNQQLQRKIDELKEQIDIKDTHTGDLNRQIKGLQVKLSQKDTQISSLKSQIESSHSQLKKEKNIQKSYQKQMLELKHTQKNYNSLRKKNLETSQDLQKWREKSQKTSLSNAQLVNKIKNLQEIVKQKNSEIHSLNEKMSGILNQYDSLKREDDQRQREAETLSIHHINASQKIEQLKSKIDISELKFNDLQSQFEDEMGYFARTKQYLENELQQYKWNYEKCKQSYEQISSKLKIANDEILELNKKSLEMEELVKKGEEKHLNLDSQIHSLNSEKNVLQSKQREYQQFLKDKNNEIYELNKKIHSLQKDCFMLEEKNKHNEKFYSQKLGGQEQLNKQKQTLITEKNEQLSSLQMKNFEQGQLISKIEKDNTILTEEVEYLKQLIEENKSEIKKLKNNIEELNKEIKDLTSSLEHANTQTDEQSQKNENLKKSKQQLNKQMTEYKANTIQALEQLLTEVSKDEDSLAYTLFSFPDESMSTLQVEAIKKRNNIIHKYREDISQLTEAKNSLEYQINKIKKLNQEQEEQLDRQLQREKQKLKNLMSESSSEKQYQFERIRTLQEKNHDLLSEIEHLNIEITEQRSMISDLQQVIQEANFNEENLKSQIKSLEHTIKNVNDQKAKIKQEYQNEISATSEQKDLQIQKTKKSIQETEKKVINIEKKNLELEQVLRKTQNNLSQAVYQRDKNEQKYIEINNKYQELMKQNKRTLENEKGHQKKKRQFVDQIGTLEKNKLSLQKKIEEIMLIKRKLEELLEEENKSKNKLSNQLQIAYETIKQLQNRIKDSGEKGKKANEKSVKQIKELKQKIISLNSEIDLKTFQINQQQTTIKGLKQNINENTNEVGQKKKDIVELQSAVENCKNENILLNQNLEIMTNEKNSLEHEVRNLKDMIENMNEQLNENQATADIIGLKEREINKLKSQIENNAKSNDKSAGQMKNIIAQMKKDISSRMTRQEELKKKIRELEKVIEEKEYDLEAERKNWEEHSDVQRAKLNKQVEQLKQEVQNLTEQADFERKQLNDQINTINQENQKLSDKVNGGEKTRGQQEQKLQKSQKQIRELRQQLKKCKQEWNAERKAYMPTQKDLKALENELNRSQKYYNEVSVKNKQLIQLIRRRANEESTSGMTELLREVSTIITRCKTKIIQRASNEKDREQIILDFKAISDKLESAFKSRHTVK